MTKKAKEAGIGQRIVAWRHQRGLSQTRLCQRSGLTPSYLSRLETGRVEPNLRTIRRIVSALRINVAELLEASPTESRGKPCPVSRSGECFMDIIDAGADEGPKDGPERYTPRQLRLIRQFTNLVGGNDRSVVQALEVLVTKMLAGHS